MSKSQRGRLPSGRPEPSSEDFFKKLNIRYRVCTKFAQKRDGKTDVCECNRPRSQHIDKGDGVSGEAVWDMLQNTEERLDPVHHTLSNGAFFMRLALDTPTAKVERVLCEYWNIPRPRLIMSIIGGTKYFKLSDRLESNFINGIVDVALRSKAWVFTNGYNVGIVQLVGQAIQKVKLTKLNEQIIATALSKWGSITDVHKITGLPDPDEQDEGKKTKAEGGGDGEKKRESGQRDLDMNHTHYLMLDDGRYRFYNIFDYRTKLCAHLAKLENEYDFPIPVVTIVVEGGMGTIINIYNDLRENIPVVIIDGSGRVADFFKRWLSTTREFDEASKDSDTPYEIGEISLISDGMSTSVSKSGGSMRKNSTRTEIHVQLDKSRNTLESRFEKYIDRLLIDLESLASHDEDSQKRKETTSKSNDEKTKQRIKEAMGQMMYCLQPAVRSGLSVFDLSSDTNLSETIFRSICKSHQKYLKRRETDHSDLFAMNTRKWKPQPTSPTLQRHKSVHQNVHRRDQTAQQSDLLLLAMDWDCIDVANELILQKSLKNILNKEEAFLYALKKDLPAFMYEFLKLGVDPTEIFFTQETPSGPRERYKNLLDWLYTDEQVASDKTHLSSFVESTGKEIRTTRDLNHVLVMLIGDYMHKLYFDGSEAEQTYRTVWALTDERDESSQVSVEVIDVERHQKTTVSKEVMYDYIMRDLFIWAILMNHTEMAKVFLSHMKYRICAALIATKILKQYHWRATHGELKDGYASNIDYFQQYAIACISQCEKNDPDLACQIVLQRIDLYGGVSCLQVAADATDKLFIATPCCVQAMNNIWFNKMHPNQSTKRNYAAIFLGFLSLGLLAPFLVNFREPRKDKSGFDRRILQPNGLNYSDPYSLEHPRYCRIGAVNRYLHNVKNFYQSLTIKFYCHCVTYCFFLLLFSYVLLFAFQPPRAAVPSIDWTEILTIILVSMMLVEEIHFFVKQDSLTFFGKCTRYFGNLFKIMTWIGFVLFYIGLVLRFVAADSEEQFTAARIVMAIDLEIWWLRSLSFIIVVPFLGPHLVAIGKMLKDLLFFMCIIAVVMTGYGVASRSMVYYPNADKFPDEDINTSFDGRSIFRQIAYPVYYMMYGEVDGELANLDANRDAGWSIATHVLLAIHMLFVNILLTNLLIAMFSKRFDQVYEDTKNIWHSQQYIFTREYYTRSPFFTPISFFYDIYYLSRIAFFAIRRTCTRNKTHDRRWKVFKMIPVNKDVAKKWYEFEGATTYEYAHAEVRLMKSAKTTTTASTDSTKTEKKEEVNDSNTGNMDANNSATNFRQLQDYLVTMNESLETVKIQLQALAKEQLLVKTAMEINTRRLQPVSDNKSS